MHDEYTEIFAQYFCQELRKVRIEQKFSQETMAEKLSISLRAYSDLERGINCCKMSTFIRFIILCPHPEKFSSDLYCLFCRKPIQKVPVLL